jgi:vancomycin permeability regulator SanA
MFKSTRKIVTRWILVIGFLAVLFTLPRRYLEWRYSSKIHQAVSAPSKDVAIVFGAGLRRDGYPSNVLADRVRVASELYAQGKVSKLLVSGSVRLPHYDEPTAMRDLAIQLGVAAEDILVDRNGSRTYDTCYHAIHNFKIEDAILVSQAFHLPRALGLCDAMGLEAEGVASDLSYYNPRALRYWELREIPAALVALWDAYVAKPDASAKLPPLG